jgi:hypothetical protein
MPAFRSSPTIEVNPPTGDREKTVVVLGAFRGGTSMVAKMLREIGVFMGSEYARPDPEYDNVEDREFQQLLHRWPILTKDSISEVDFPREIMDPVVELIERRNLQHSLWGWKYPGTVLWCLYGGLTKYLRNPHFITVFRDPVAIFQHQADKGCIPAADIRRKEGLSLRWIAKHNQHLVEHVMQSNAPHLLVSYERTMTGGEEAIESLIERMTAFVTAGSSGGDWASASVGNPASIRS